MPLSHYAPHQLGHVDFVGDSEFEAGAFVSFRIVYHVGRFGIDDNGSLKIAFRTTNDNGGLQLTEPLRAGYTTVTCSGDAKIVGAYERWRNIRPWSRSLYLRVTDGFLAPGDTITIDIGDRSQGSPGFRVQTFCEHRSPIKVFVDPLATYDYVELPSSPVFTVRPGNPESWRAVLPSRCGRGEPFRLCIKADDRWGNPTDRAEAMLTLRPTRPVTGLPETLAYDRGRLAAILSDLTFHDEGPLWIDLLDAQGRVLARSNPVQVADHARSERHFWGDLHHQTNETAGTNTARDMFRFARDLAFLDVASHQGNDFQITDAFWNDLNAATAAFNDEGRFVAIPGYEWSGNTAVGGDRNIWFHDEGQPIRRSSRVLLPEGADETSDCHTVRDLFHALRGANVVVAAHCGGRYADIDYAHDGSVEHSVEIHSAWGTFEWLLHQAFTRGYRVGIVANSDGHKGRPGSEFPGASQFGARGGLTCFLAPALTRDAIFEAMRRRHHYATTGGRLFMDVRAELPSGSVVYERDPSVFPAASAAAASTAIMGDIAGVSGTPVRMRATVIGQAPIERIEIRDGMSVVKTVRPHALSDLGARVRIVWSGARYRGRNRDVNWDGSLGIEGNAIRRFATANFLNPERAVTQDSDRALRWQSTTTGTFSAIDLWLADPLAGVLDIATKEICAKVEIAAIGYEDTRLEVGPIDRTLRLFRLPETCSSYRVDIDEEVDMSAREEKRLYLCVTQEDGIQAWSSPIYLMPAPDL